MKNSIVNHYKIHAFKDRDQFLDQIKDEHKILVAMNAEKILKDDERLREIVNRNIGYPDGIGAVMALRKKGLDAVKIPGAEFWLDIIGRYKDEKSFYLIGSSQEVIERTVDKLQEQFPDINIVGYRDGFLKDDDKEILKKALITLKPDIVFVAQGSPRQEFLMDELMGVHSALYMGLGGSFDVYCGFKKRAPKLFINLGLEWFYRLLKEPTRIGRQMVLGKFLALLFFGKL
ncbi:putative UDP-N-acetyl-D-mannosaminuronic acid transferase (UDP-ManNAcA transferase) [Sulfurovum sp. enrichment culture clone C5]|uniref:Putative UDP-N-acetyl-D-mannosaminuronic acid transferase (UDP-ManNAcA transferase) n=1 Tax=Sulfurovum sp. enrichment culture clone C5 TaxID=497650 RepID=A0A0S4XQ36_9BACT|nr:putative UDP-N-acetyl-D-mannosaminuronic acid transferase (UDP-ManNAcA transferase) [Sulfurovum sp. enrichment culture clone C5]